MSLQIRTRYQLHDFLRWIGNRHTQRRCLSDSMRTFTSDSAASRTKRRKGRPTRKPTLKDRIRTREGNIISSRRNAFNEDLLLERASTRVEWARESFRRMWQEATEASGGDIAIVKRPERTDLVMDANWWAWNILLMLSPGLLIAAYCQFVGKERMIRSLSQNQHSQALISQNEEVVQKPSLWESLTDLIHWINGEETPQRSKPSRPEETNLHNVATDVRLEQIDALKQQLLALEAQIQGSEVDPVTTEKPQVSPIQRRRLEQRQKQQQARAKQLEEEEVPRVDVSSRSMTLEGAVKIVETMASDAWRNIRASITPDSMSQEKVDDVDVGHNPRKPAVAKLHDEKLQESKKGQPTAQKSDRETEDNALLKASSQEDSRGDKSRTSISTTKRVGEQAGGQHGQHGASPAKEWWKLW